MTATTPAGLAALAAWDVGDDPTQAPGIHLRVLLHPRLGMPILPLAIYRRTTRGREWPTQLTLWRQNGEPRRLPVKVTPDAPLELWLRPDIHNLGIPLWCQILGDGDLRVAAEHPQPAPDGTHAEFAARSEHPWALAVPGLRRVVITGRGDVEGVLVCGDEEVPRPSPEPSLELALPVTAAPWYLPAISSARRPSYDAMRRVREGVNDPHRLWPVDDPTGMLTAGADDEVARVLTLVEEPLAWLQAALGDPDVLPSEHEIHLRDESGWTSSMNTSSALSAAAVDPGLARYLGLMARQSPPKSGDLVTYAAATVTAVRPAAPGDPSRAIFDTAAPVDADEWLTALRKRSSGLPELMREIAGHGFLPVVRVAAGACALNCPPDPPRAPSVGLGAGYWDPEGTGRYRQMLTLAGAGPGALAVARISERAHEAVPLGEPYEVPTATEHRRRRRLTVPSRPPADAGLRDRSLAALSDDAAPADSSCWLVHAADLAGRWGPPARVDAAPPAVPPLPQPMIEAHHLPRPDGAPGVIDIRVRHPDRFLPGPWYGVKLVLSNPPWTDPVNPGKTSVTSAPATPSKVVIRGRYEYDWGDAARSDDEPEALPDVEVSVRVTVPVAPSAPAPAFALQFGSPADPTGTAYLQLDVPAGVNVRDYRLTRYEEADVRPAPPELAGASRAERANWYLHHPERFTGPGRLVQSGCLPGSTITVALSGSLRSLVFLRLIPASPTGATLPAGRCPLLACAVPDGDAPAPPTISPGPPGSGQLLITCLDPEGRLDQVRARYAPAGSGVRGPHMPALAPVPLAPADPQGLRTAVVSPPPSEPFVTVAYTAEASRPPERALAPGASPAPGEVVRDAPRIWGPPATPVLLRPRPPGPPPAPAAVRVDVPGPYALSVTATIPGTVPTGSSAPPHRLEAFLFDDAGVGIAVGEAQILDRTTTCLLRGTGPGTVRARLVDPDQRAGPAVVVFAPSSEPPAGGR